MHRSGYGLAQVTTNGGWEPSSNVSYPDLPNVYLPLISRPTQFKGIFGRVTQNSARAAAIPVDLRFYNGSAWSTAGTTQTDSNGNYTFPDASSLAPGQKYYVRYANAANDPTRLWTWAMRGLTEYTSGGETVIGDFDIAEVPLMSPANNATVYLPASF